MGIPPCELPGARCLRALGFFSAANKKMGLTKGREAVIIAPTSEQQETCEKE